MDRMRRQEMVAEAWIHLVSLFRMDESLSWGREIWRWTALKREFGGVVESNVDKILTAANMEGRLYTRNQLSDRSI